MIRRPPERHEIRGYATRWRNGTLVVSFTQLSPLHPLAPDEAFANSIFRWKELLGIAGQGIKDEAKRKWVLTAEFVAPEPLEQAIQLADVAFAENRVTIHWSHKRRAYALDYPMWMLS